jgi:hypothetical protein
LHLAYLNMFLKNEEEAISCLEIAYDENHPRIYCIKSSHDFEPLRLHPRFIALLSKLEFEGGTE